MEAKDLGTKMKIFTDTKKWDDRWFRKLSPATKLIYLYICDLSDHAGIWEFDGDMVRLHIGVPYDDNELKRLISLLGDKVKELPKEEYWITNYIYFQNPKGISRRFKHCAPIYRSLEKRGIDPEDFQQSALDIKDESRESEEAWDAKVMRIATMWNETCKNLPSVTKANIVRYKLILRCEKEKISFLELFNKVVESDFLMGKSTEWNANFDWVLKPQNAVKILEGNYANTNRRSNSAEDYSKGF